MLTLTLYIKPDCPLCDEALDELEAARHIVPFTLEVVSIRTDLALYEKYKDDIPVVCLEGEELFRHRVFQAELLQKLSR